MSRVEKKVPWKEGFTQTGVGGVKVWPWCGGAPPGWALNKTETLLRNCWGRSESRETLLSSARDGAKVLSKSLGQLTSNFHKMKGFLAFNLSKRK